MIIPTFNQEQLDLYVTYTFNNGKKCDIAVPQSMTSYTAYLLNNIETWTYWKLAWSSSESTPLRYASAKLLLILKKYMLYYPNQWQKTANDYQQLLTITDPLTNDDIEFCNLFIQYNEKLHGQRSPNKDQFALPSSQGEENVVIKRDEFLQLNKDQQIACAYRAAKEFSISNDLLIGLEHICTKSPLWLADFVIEHLVDIHNEKFKDSIRLSSPAIHCKINNYRLFEQLPELVTEKILLNITDPLDFHSMKLVCKQ